MKRKTITRLNSTKKHKNINKNGKYHQNKNKRKTNKRKRQNKVTHKKNKIYKNLGGGVNPSDGFIIEIDEDGIPVNNSLDFENAEIYIKNFLFTENYIKTYLEPNKAEFAELVSFTYLDYGKLYSGDETKLFNVIEEYTRLYPELFLKIFAIIDPLSYKELLYKSDTTTPLTISPYRSGISVSSGGGRGDDDKSSSPYVFSSLSPLSDEDEIQPAVPVPAALVPAPASDDDYVIVPPADLLPPLNQPDKKNIIGVLCLSVFALFKPVPKKIINRERNPVAAAPAVPAVPVPVPAAPALVPMPIPKPKPAAPVTSAVTFAVPAPAPAAAANAILATLSKSERRHVITFNFVSMVKQFICKLSVNPTYLKHYEREYNTYTSLRKTLIEQGVGPDNILENFFRWQKETTPFIKPVPINLNFTTGGSPIYKKINLIDNVTNLDVDIAKNIVPIIGNKITWGSLNGTYNPRHIDLSRIIQSVMYIEINTNLNKIKTGLQLIFNNLYLFYIITGFIHCDFKTDNILVEINDAVTDVTKSLLFDLDLSFQISEEMYKYDSKMAISDNRKKLDNIMVLSIINVYLKIEDPSKTKTISYGFLHFFDCYFAALTLIADAYNHGNLSIVDEAVKSMEWNPTDPYHSINIFKTCYDFIRAAGIVTPHLNTSHWINLNFDNVSAVMSPVNPRTKALFPTFPEPKKMVYRWILLNFTK